MPSSSMGVTIRFRNGAWWLFINNRGTRRAKKVGEYETAKQVARQVRQALVAGDLRVLQPLPDEALRSYADSWIRGLTGTLKASTVRFYRENLDRHILPLLGDRTISRITRVDCRMLITTSRERGSSWRR
jgi:hypothetical protein